MTTKIKPHYLLNNVKKLAMLATTIFSNGAKMDAAKLGIVEQGMLDAIHQLTYPGDFLKSESGYHDPSKWQDAYVTYFAGCSIYIKLMISTDPEDLIIPRKLVVTSFKLNTN